MDKKFNLDKKFSYKGIVITRKDYESLPCSMAAVYVNDSRMRELVKNIYTALINEGWKPVDISNYCQKCSRGEELDYTENAIDDDFWRVMENVAIEHGMKYYEDLPDTKEKSSKLFDDVQEKLLEVKKQLTDFNQLYDDVLLKVQRRDINLILSNVDDILGNLNHK